MRKELYDSGYFDGRKVDNNKYVQAIINQGMPLVDVAVSFLEKYSKLDFRNAFSRQSYIVGVGCNALNKKAQCYIQNLCGEKSTEIAVVYTTILGSVSIFITESGNFYLERGNKIADNEEEFWDYVFSSNEKLEVIIDPKIYDILRKADWYEGRKIDSSKYVELLKKGGHTESEILKPAVDFYEEFGEIKISVMEYFPGDFQDEPDEREIVNTCLQYMQGSPPRNVLFKAGHYKGHDFARHFTEKVNTVGIAGMACLIVSETGKVLADSGCLLGTNFTEAWNTIFKKC